MTATEGEEKVDQRPLVVVIENPDELEDIVVTDGEAVETAYLTLAHTQQKPTCEEEWATLEWAIEQWEAILADPRLPLEQHDWFRWQIADMRGYLKEREQS